MSFEISNRHYDNIHVWITENDGELVLRFYNHTHKELGEPKFIKFYTKGTKVGIQAFRHEPEEPFNRVSDNNTVSLSWFRGTKSKTIKPGQYALRWHKSGLWTFNPETSPVDVQWSHDRFSEQYEETILIGD